MNYENIYTTIINRSRDRLPEGYLEEHHIIPRCMGGTDDKNNLVLLTPEEHYVCHQLLVKIYPNNIRLVKAAMFMVSGSKYVRRSNKVYGWLKKRYSEYMKGPNNPQKLNPIKGKDHWAYGTSFDKSCWTEDSIRVMSESKEGDKNPNFGIKPWNHGRATEYTKSVWAKADEIRSVWEENNRPSYCKLYSLVNGKSSGRDWEAIGPYMNMVKYFRNGWVPTEDTEWIKMRENKE